VHIFRHCIRGVLRDKAVVWITHQLDLLAQCDSVAVMEAGAITYFGTYHPDVRARSLCVLPVPPARCKRARGGRSRKRQTA